MEECYAAWFAITIIALSFLFCAGLGSSGVILGLFKGFFTPNDAPKLAFCMTLVGGIGTIVTFIVLTANACGQAKALVQIFLEKV